jgi:hypothetical protein
VQERCTKMVRDACALRNGNGLPPARRKAPHPRGRPGIIPVHFLVCSVKQMWKKSSKRGGVPRPARPGSASVQSRTESPPWAIA